MSGNDEKKVSIDCVCGYYRGVNNAFYLIYDSFGDLIGFLNTEKFLNKYGRLDKVNPRWKHSWNIHVDDMISRVRTVTDESKSFKCSTCARVYVITSSIGRAIFEYARNFYEELILMEDVSIVWE